MNIILENKKALTKSGGRNVCRDAVFLNPFFCSRQADWNLEFKFTDSFSTYLEIRKYKLTQMSGVQNYNSLQLFLDLGKALNHWVIAEQKFSSSTKFQIKSQSISRLLRVHTTYRLHLTTGIYTSTMFKYGWFLISYRFKFLMLQKP